MAGIFDSPMTQPGMKLHSGMALDDDGSDGHAVDPSESGVLKQKPGISQAASGDEEDPWAV
jgi:hypothetical protein